MQIDVPEAALAAGFINSRVGTHSSRTIMLREVRALLASCPTGAELDDYRRAVIDENVALKATLSTRAKSFRHLRELYGLSATNVLFSALRELWDADPDGQPLVAVLCACARDPLPRASAALVLSQKNGHGVSSSALAAAVSEAFPNRYEPGTLARIGRNLASSWQQSGHLTGRLTKTRARARSTPAAVTYGLLLGYLCGARGDALFRTLWARLLDSPEHDVRHQAGMASRQGWLEYRESGGVTEVTFHHLLRGRKEV